MANRHAAHAFKAVAFGSVAASFTDIGLTLPGDGAGLIILNSLDEAVEVGFAKTGTLAANVATAFELAAAEPLIINYFAMNRLFPAGSVFLRRLSGAPTAGRIRFTVVR